VLLFDVEILLLFHSFYVVTLSYMDGNAEGVEDADLVLLVTTRPTTGNTLAWAVACERDQWGRAIAGKTNGQTSF
jgi:hypothetical protein